jgi:hypothetical protein
MAIAKKIEATMLYSTDIGCPTEYPISLITSPTPNPARIQKIVAITTENQFRSFLWIVSIFLPPLKYIEKYYTKF